MVAVVIGPPKLDDGSQPNRGAPAKQQGGKQVPDSDIKMYTSEEVADILKACPAPWKRPGARESYQRRAHRLTLDGAGVGTA